MKDNAILCNAGHFDCEIDIASLRKVAISSKECRNNIVGYEMSDGRVLNVLGDGRLVNLACGMGHPAEIMDMSFAVQALSLNWLAEHKDELTTKVYKVPDSIDDEIGHYKLGAPSLFHCSFQESGLYEIIHHHAESSIIIHVVSSASRIHTERLIRVACHSVHLCIVDILVDQ